MNFLAITFLQTEGVTPDESCVFSERYCQENSTDRSLVDCSHFFIGINRLSSENFVSGGVLSLGVIRYLVYRLTRNIWHLLGGVSKSNSRKCINIELKIPLYLGTDCYTVPHGI